MSLVLKNPTPAPHRGDQHSESMLGRIADIRDVIKCRGSKVRLTMLESLGHQFLEELDERTFTNVKSKKYPTPFQAAATSLAAAFRVRSYEADGARLRKTSILEGTRDMINEGMNGVRLAMAFIGAGAIQDRENVSRESIARLRGHTHPVSKLALPGPEETTDVQCSRNRIETITAGSNEFFQWQNSRDNYIRLLTGDEIHYDQLYGR